MHGFFDTLAWRDGLVASGMPVEEANARTRALSRAIQQLQTTATAYPATLPLPEGYFTAFDTLTYRDELIAGGIPPNMATAETRAVEKALRESFSLFRHPSQKARFDAFGVLEILVKGGFTVAQAKAEIEAVGKAIEEAAIASLASKGDTSELELDIVRLEWRTARRSDESQ